MKGTFILLGLLLAPIMLFAQVAEEGQILRVIDGDTVLIHIQGVEERMRIVGIDTPETVKSGSPVECFGIEATNNAKSLLGPQQVVNVLLQKERDKYDRLLGYIDIDGIDFGAEMIKRGYAFAYRSFNHERRSDYILMEQLAREDKIGLWSPTACADNPESDASAIIYQEKISFWQNIFKTLKEFFNLLQA